MYTLTLETNTQCNLHCRYCYLGEKSFREMPPEVWRKAIDIALHEAVKQYDKTLFICFLGGEPLLSTATMEEIIKYVDRVNSNLQLKISYGLTTNGTLYNDAIEKILRSRPFTIRLSLDGNQKVQNLNRIDYNRKGSYNEVIQNLPYFKKICSSQNEMLRVVQVITTNNVQYYFDGFRHLIDDLGLTYLESGTNNEVEWNDDDLKVLRTNLEMTIEYYASKIKNHKILSWNMYSQNLHHFLFPHRCFYGCMAGLAASFVNVDGNIYFCRECNELQIGSVFDGLDYRKIREIAYIKETKNMTCLDCEYLEYCYAKSCFTENYIKNNDLFTPPRNSCEVTKVFIGYFKKNFSIDDIERMRNSMRNIIRGSC